MDPRGKGRGTVASQVVLFKRATSSKSYERNLDNFKLLVAYLPFQTEIHRIRDELGIKVGGFTLDDEVEKWTTWCTEETAKLLSSNRFKEHEKQIRRAGQEGKIRSHMMCKQLDLLFAELPINAPRAYADYLIGRFNLPHNYQDALWRYMVRGTISAPHQNFSAAPETAEKHKHGNARPITITIYTRLTEDEQKELVGYVDWLTGKQALPQYETLAHIDRDVEIQEAYDAYRHNPNFAERGTLADLAEEYLRDKKKSNQISAIMRNLRRIQKARFDPMTKSSP